MRLVILSGRQLSAFQLRVLDSLLESHNVELVGACVDVRPPLAPLRKLVRELRKGRGGYVIVQAIRSAARPRSASTDVAAASYFAEHSVDLIETEDLYDERALGFIEERRPDLIFRTGFGIIREPVLSIAPKGVISFHHGDLRKYRGIPPGFWELYHAETRMGVTVQVLGAGIDCGRVVCELEIPIHETDTWRSLEHRAFERSFGMISEACRLLERDDFEPKTISAEELGRLFTTPNLRQWLLLHCRVAVRRLKAWVRRSAREENAD